MTTAEHLAQEPRTVIAGGFKVTFRPIFCHPFTGWEIVSAEEMAEDPQLAANGYTRADEAAYIAWCEEEAAEHERELAHGGRSRCGKCSRYGVEHRTVSTGYDRSTLSTCRYCGHEEFAG